MCELSKLIKNSYEMINEAKLYDTLFDFQWKFVAMYVYFYNFGVKSIFWIEGWFGSFVQFWDQVNFVEIQLVIRSILRFFPHTIL